MWPESSSFYIRNGNFGDSLLCCSPPRCPPKQILVGGGAATGGKGKLHFTPTMEFIILPIVYVISFWPPEKSNYKTLCILYTSILFYLFIQHAAQDGETSLSFLFRRKYWCNSNEKICGGSPPPPYLEANVHRHFKLRWFFAVDNSISGKWSEITCIFQVVKLQHFKFSGTRGLADISKAVLQCGTHCPSMQKINPIWRVHHY